MFPESLTLLSKERPVVWTNAKRTTLQLSLARPAEWCLCTEGCCKTAFLLLGKQPEGSQCAMKTDFVWATVLFCLWHTGCFICHGQLFIHFDTVLAPCRAGWNSIERDKGKHSIFFFSSSFSRTYLPFFFHSLLKNLSTVRAWKQLVSSLPDSCPRAGVLWGQLLGMCPFSAHLVCHPTLLHCHLHSPIGVVLLNGNERASLRKIKFKKSKQKIPEKGKPSQQQRRHEYKKSNTTELWSNISSLNCFTWFFPFSANGTVYKEQMVEWLLQTFITLLWFGWFCNYFTMKYSTVVCDNIEVFHSKNSQKKNILQRRYLFPLHTVYHQLWCVAELAETVLNIAGHLKEPHYRGLLSNTGVSML